MVKIIGKQLRSICDKLYEKEEIPQHGDNELEFETLFRGFMKPYFRSIDCEETKQAMQALDKDDDGIVEWSGFMVYVKRALSDKDELLSLTFNKGLIPVMLDEERSK